MRRVRIACALTWAFFLVGCSGGGVAVDGRASGYAPDVPDFDLDAVIASVDDPIEIEAFVSIPRASLVFTRGDEGFQAIVRTAFRLADRSDRPLASPARTDTLRVETFEETASFVPLVVRQRIQGVPGDLVLQAEVEDTSTGRTALRRLRVQVPEDDSELSMSAILLQGVLSGTDAFRPLIAFGVPQNVDSLEARLSVFGARGSLDVRATLLKLEADTSVAEPPAAFSPGRTSLRAKGVDIGASETVVVTRQRLNVPSARLTVQTALPPLSPGVYRLEMDAQEVEGEAEANSSRTFVVRPSGFPRLAGLRDLVEPLAYLATPREMRLLRDAPGDPLRLAFDAFWGGLFQD